MQSMKEFCEKCGLTMNLKRASNNPHMDDRTMNHYRATLKHDKKQMTIPFSTGSGWKEDPKIQDIVDCLVSNSDCLEYNFEEWANILGYDSYNRKAEKIYKVCVKQSEKFKNMLGKELFEELLYNTETDFLVDFRPLIPYCVYSQLNG